MSNAQLTPVQIDNSGPWTATPWPRPAVDIQTLQGQLLADVSPLLGGGGGYPFHLRFDDMVALTNGLDRNDHVHIREAIGNRYPVAVSQRVEADPSPVEVLAAATANLHAAGSAQNASASDHFEAVTGLSLQIGIGRGATAQQAGGDAERAREVCRTNGTRVERRSSGSGERRTDR